CGGVSRYADHYWRLQFDQQGDYAYCYRCNPHTDRLLDERYDRCLRPHPREPRAVAERATGRSGEPEYQSDPEQDGDLFRTDIYDCALPLSVRRRGTEWILIRPRRRYFDRHVLFDRCGGTDAGGVPGMAQKAGQDGCPARG